MLTVGISQNEALFGHHTHMHAHWQTNGWWVNRPLSTFSYQFCFLAARSRQRSVSPHTAPAENKQRQKDYLLWSIDCIVIGDWSKGGWAAINGHPGKPLTAVFVSKRSAASDTTWSGFLLWEMKSGERRRTHKVNCWRLSWFLPLSVFFVSLPLSYKVLWFSFFLVANIYLIVVYILVFFTSLFQISFLLYFYRIFCLYLPMWFCLLCPAEPVHIKGRNIYNWIPSIQYET